MNPATEPTATIVVRAKAGVDPSAAQPLINQVVDRSAGSLFANGYSKAPDGDFYDLVYNGPTSAIAGIVQQLGGSALISSVKVNTGQS
jgi:hypothetical protein